MAGLVNPRLVERFTLKNDRTEDGVLGELFEMGAVNLQGSKLFCLLAFLGGTTGVLFSSRARLRTSFSLLDAPAGRPKTSPSIVPFISYEPGETQIQKVNYQSW